MQGQNGGGWPPNGGMPYPPQQQPMQQQPQYPQQPLQQPQGYPQMPMQPQGYPQQPMQGGYPAPQMPMPQMQQPDYNANPFAGLSPPDPSMTKYPFLEPVSAEIAAVYKLQIVKVRHHNSRKGKSLYIIEVDIEASNHPARPAGMRCAAMIDLSQPDTWTQHVIGFLASAHGVQPSTITKGMPKTPWSGEDWVTAAAKTVDESNPMAGWRVGCTTSQIITRANKPFTLNSWSPVEETIVPPMAVLPPPAPAQLPYPQQPPAAGYPPAQAYPQQPMQQPYGSQQGYPQQPPAAAYPQQQPYPQQPMQAPQGYPQQPPAAAYPQQQPYPQQPPAAAYPQQPAPQYPPPGGGPGGAPWGGPPR
jgi:hypothetical protein